MAIKRDAPYIWVTWITKIIAGEENCIWKGWFRAHNKYDKKPSDFNLAEWTVNHNNMLRQRVESLKNDGFDVYVEGQNDFKIKGSTGATLAGKADIVAIKDDGALIIDCKTGQERHSDKMQVLIYMLILPKTHRAVQGKKIIGEIQYNSASISIDANDVSEDFKKTFRECMQQISDETAPEKVPSYSECSFCDITKDDCPDRIDEAPKTVETDLF
jgi:RecB family exonuclease